VDGRFELVTLPWVREADDRHERGDVCSVTPSDTKAAGRAKEEHKNTKC
jgi:hypothetical protein